MGGEKAIVAGDERAQFLPAAVGAGQDGTSSAAEGKASWPIARRLVHAAGVVRDFLARELARDMARGMAFLCLPVLMAAGVATYFALPHEPGGLGIVLAVVLCGVLSWVLRDRPVAVLTARGLLVFSVGIAAAKLETVRADSPMTGSAVTTNVTGRLVQMEHQASGRIRLTIDLADTERPRLRYPPDRVRLSARAVPEGLRPGDAVKGLARLMPATGPVRPGTYDFSFASYFNGYDAVGFFMSGPERAEEVTALLPAWTAPARLLQTMREGLAQHIRTRIGGPEGEIAVAVITGFRAGIPPEINEWLRIAGLAHILAISGMHMALVAATVMVLVRVAFALFPGFSSRMPVKKFAAVAALGMCTLYLFISGGAVAAQRSYIMLAVMLTALFFDRAAISMRNVAIAALIIIALSPHVVVGPSFQMSFAATAALVAGYGAWNEWRRGRLSGRPAAVGLGQHAAKYALAFIVGLAATSIIAGTATALYGIWHFQRTTPLALPANMAAMPIVSLIAMPSALLGMLALPFGLDGFFLGLMGRGIAAVVAIAAWFAERSPFDAVGLMPLSALLALTAALVVVVVSTTWLRAAALVFAVAGVGLLTIRQLPHALVTEDARLVGLRGGEGTLAVNRARPNAFTMDDWTRALVIETVVRPESSGEGAPAVPAEGAAGFVCGDGLCLARHESGALVAHAETPQAARHACGRAALIVLDDAVDAAPCGAGSVALVLSKRDLAQQGSAAIRFDEGPQGVRAEVTFAIGDARRPWHAHRAWSRAARGLPP